ncbi:CBS domain containing protein [Alkaliphilus metalliredigens QYMF]|uniref:CBS domain containing protein n=1 Tax=Alkaliphilus metalliredigens (strain QYMF) TaxID=293826 RepID=A6TL14_ALKMQ|nr:CBS domain-containing protein [Alkaliphilus metalliredigens]ABR46882.1 CBS domain containing protein [Alkaliphilus metalliredigens QYMF]
MNIAFFLTPKRETIYLTEDATMRQALEKMEHHRYSAVPIVDQAGRYIETMTEGDLLWKLKNTKDLTLKDTNKVKIKEVSKYMDVKPVLINAKVEDLVHLIINQNFVPVVDDNGVFIGIVKRSTIITYFSDLIVGNFDDKIAMKHLAYG